MNGKPVLNIMDAILQCDYTSSNKDIITLIIYDTFLGVNKVHMYMLDKYNYKTAKFEKLIVVKCIITSQVNTKIYEIPILMYFPRLFPAEPPEVYIERNDEIGINPKSQLCVDKNSFRVKVPSILSWNMMKSTVAGLIKDLYKEFNSVFPVYKLDLNERGKHKVSEECVLKHDFLTPISFDAPLYSENEKLANQFIQNNHNINPMNQQHHINNQPKVNNPQPQPQPQPNQIPMFSDEQIKKIYLNELIHKLKDPIIDTKTQLYIIEDELQISKNNFIKEINEIQSLSEKKDDIIKAINKLSNEVQEQIDYNKSYIQLNNVSNEDNKNFDNLIKISDEQLLKVICAEATLEDFLFYIRKGFEKNIFTFQETMKLIRTYSRELFRIKYIRQKLTK